MKTKEIFLIIVGIALVSAGAYFMYVKKPGSVQAPGQEETKKEIKIEDKKIQENEKRFRIDITYPFIDGQNEFNNIIKNYIDKQITDFKNDSLENDAIIKKADPESYGKYPETYDMQAAYSKGKISEDAISIVFETYTFQGGAHGNTTFYSFNYSPKDKKEIRLADLFPNQPDYLQKISDYCVADLKEQIKGRIGGDGGAWLQEGAGPKEENFSIFIIKENNLIFYFPQYQVAGYAAGHFEVTMPLP